MRFQEFIPLLALMLASCVHFAAADPVGREPGPYPPGQKLTNPIEPSPQSLKAGKAVYVRDCRVCHGEDGRGHTEMVEFLLELPPDLLDGKWKYGSSDGEIFTIIRDGTATDMIGFGEKLNDQRMWHLVNYIRSLAPKSEDEEHNLPVQEVLENPFDLDAASVRAGKAVYLRDCRVCHGEDGRGHTEMVEFLAVKPSNLIDEEWTYGSEDADLYRVIRDGTDTEMEGFGDKLSVERMWHVVNYLRSIGPKPEDE